RFSEVLGGREDRLEVNSNRPGGRGNFVDRALLGWHVCSCSSETPGRRNVCNLVAMLECRGGPPPLQRFQVAPAEEPGAGLAQVQVERQSSPAAAAGEA